MVVLGVVAGCKFRFQKTMMMKSSIPFNRLQEKSKPGTGVEVVEIASLKVDSGWHEDDPEMMIRLVGIVRRYGQLRPVVVGTLPDGTKQVVDGRKLLEALRRVGMVEALIVDLGPVWEGWQTDIQLALLCGFEVDYVRVACAVADRLASGTTRDELALRSPFTTERLDHFNQLATFDWTQLSTNGNGTAMLDWDAEPVEEEVTVPVDATAGELVMEADALPPETPVIEVMQQLRAHRRRKVNDDQAMFEF